MTNNDILRRLRYVFDFNDTKMIGLFRDGGMAVTRVQLTAWLKKEEDAGYVRLTDPEMATFLNGLIIEKRGRQDGAQPEPEKRLTNNIVFRKLKIALNLTAEDILDMLKLSGVSISKHELSALFRRAGHQNYRECKDQVLRNFLTGLQHKLRDKAPATKTDRSLRKTASAKASRSNPVRKTSTGQTEKQKVKKPSVSNDSVWARALEKTGKNSNQK